jgi:hypothetical protein
LACCHQRVLAGDWDVCLEYWVLMPPVLMACLLVLDVMCHDDRYVAQTGSAQKAHSAYHSSGPVLGCAIDAKTEKVGTFHARAWNLDYRIGEADLEAL